MSQGPQNAILELPPDSKEGPGASFLLPILLQVLLIIHVVKTGRDRFWIYILVFIPLAGGIAYFIIEILPDILRSSATRNTVQEVSRAMNPNKEFEAVSRRAEMSPTVENISLLGLEHLKRKNYTEAEACFKRCLNGPFSDSIPIMTNLAETYYASGQFGEAETLLNEITTLQGEDVTAEIMLLHGNVKAALGNYEAADSLLRQAASRASDLKYKYWYGRFLSQRGDSARANDFYNQILISYENMPKYSRKFNRRWVDLVKQELQKTG